MSDTALTVENVSKLYRIGTEDESYRSLQGSLKNIIRKPIANFRKYRSLYKFSEAELSGQQVSDNTLWALRDVSFEVARGEVIGIVGANGAGKSTLLKIISRITPPTKGRLTIHGRVSCLLEVGTGFHGELTGRENVYMSGTILGMRKVEVDAKFDQIVDFSGISKFIDTPVKRYSSGMSVRLAFAVMAHLEPEILVIDEVLAVGDAEFQRKCLNKMSSVGKHGRTVLFVSHNMASITRLCDRGLFLQKGQLVQDGSAAEIVHNYITGGGDTAGIREWPDIDESPGDDSVRLRSVRIVSKSGATVSSVDASETIGLEVTFDVLEQGQILSPYFTLVSDAGIDLFSTTDADKRWELEPRSVGRYVCRAWIPGDLLVEGTHYVRAVMRSIERQYRPFTERDVVAFNVVDKGGSGLGTGWWEGRPLGFGVIRPHLEWTTEYVPQEMIING